MIETAEIKDMKDMIASLTAENKKYVIAVANALVFSQNDRMAVQPRKPPTKLEEEKAAKANGTKERPKTAYPSEKAAV